jgi:uncharacterized caspase-like protein
VVVLSLACTALAGAGRRTIVVDADALIDAAQSAGLFVGVREFTYDTTLAEVRYAVDDAVDLAFVLALEREPRLVDAKRVVLALSGEPQKAESQDRLKKLLAAGASRRTAGHSEVLTLLDAQAANVGGNGILIVSFATHGMSEDGVQFLLASDSLLLKRGTKITDAEVVDAVSRAGVRRALILLDACRQRLTKDTRAGDADPRAAAGLLQDLAKVEGRVVLSAAAPGKYAYDDEVLRNGVFTAAVMEGLRCGAATNDRGFVTADTLSSYVEERVLQWVQRNRDRDARVATQLQCDGASKKMPLAVCVSGKAEGSEPHPR